MVRPIGSGWPQRKIQANAHKSSVHGDRNILTSQLKPLDDPGASPAPSCAAMHLVHDTVRMGVKNQMEIQMKLFRLIFVTGVVVMALTAGLFAADQKAQDLYKSKCQGCHGADGKATAIGKKLGAKDFQEPDVAKLTEADLAKITEAGKNKMPAYKGKLSDIEIKSLAKYIKEMK